MPDKLSGLQNMQKDLSLFDGLEAGKTKTTLRIYSWSKPCISLGYSQKIEEEIDVEKAQKMGWDVVVRPTGGGIVFHNTAEVTYSYVTELDNPQLPKGLVASYKKISEAVVYALGKIGIEAEIRKPCLPAGRSKLESRQLNVGLCFSYPAEYEVVCNGKKIVGSAQKRGKKTILQQGSIFVRRTPSDVFSVLKKTYNNLDAISVEEVLGRNVKHKELETALVEGFNMIGLT